MAPPCPFHTSRGRRSHTLDLPREFDAACLTHATAHGILGKVNPPIRTEADREALSLFGEIRRPALPVQLPDAAAWDLVQRKKKGPL